VKSHTNAYQLKGKVMVDFHSFQLHTQVSDDDFRYRPRPPDRIGINPSWKESPGDGCECTSCLSRLDRAAKLLSITKYFYKVGSETEEPKQDHFFMLCDYVILGYALEQRQWCKYINM
jgi:hypothetical protein